MVIDYTRKRYRKRKFFNSLRDFFWSLFCLVAAIVGGIVVIIWAMPWLKSLFSTISK